MSETIEEALATVPPEWSWSIGEMRGLPVERRYRCFLSNHDTADGIADGNLVEDAASPVQAINAAVAKAHRHWRWSHIPDEQMSDLWRTAWTIEDRRHIQREIVRRGLPEPELRAPHGRVRG